MTGAGKPDGSAAPASDDRADWLQILLRLYVYGDLEAVAPSFADWIETARTAVVVDALRRNGFAGDEWPDIPPGEPVPGYVGKNPYLKAYANGLPGQRIRRPAATAHGWQHILRALREGRLRQAGVVFRVPVANHVTARWASARATSFGGSADSALSLWLARRNDPDGPGHVAHLLEADVVTALLGGPPIDRAIQDAWVALAITGAQRARAATGWLRLGYKVGERPTTERALRERSHDIIYFADRYLALGHWGTFLSGPHLAALGGRAAVLRSAPVFRAIDCTVGDWELVFLQLTEDMNAVPDARIADLDAYLSPALLPRWPHLDIGVGRLPDEIPDVPAEASPEAGPERADEPPSMDELADLVEAAMAHVQADAIIPDDLPFKVEWQDPGPDVRFTVEFDRAPAETDTRVLQEAIAAWALEGSTVGFGLGPVSYVSEVTEFEGDGGTVLMEWQADLALAGPAAVSRLVTDLAAAVERHGISIARLSITP